MSPRILCVILISHGLLAAQETPPAGPVTSAQTAVVGPIADGTPPPPPAPPPPLPDFKIRSTSTTRIMREEPSGVPGLPPVRKEVTVTVHLVEDPHLPTPLPPPSADMSDPAALAEMPEVLADEREPEAVFLSATVYDHQRTLLRWWPDDGSDREMTAWSNIDFNHLCGFSEYTYKGRRFSLVMGIGDENTAPLGIGNENTADMAGVVLEDGSEYQPPQPPELPTDGPGFVVTGGDPLDAAATDVITGLHELYKVEGKRLKAAYEARVQAQVEREAYLRANPPQPQDLIIKHWNTTGQTPLPAATDLPARSSREGESR